MSATERFFFSEETVGGSPSSLRSLRRAGSPGPKASGGHSRGRSRRNPSVPDPPSRPEDGSYPCRGRSTRTQEGQDRVDPSTRGSPADAEQERKEKKNFVNKTKTLVRPTSVPRFRLSTVFEGPFPKRTGLGGRPEGGTIPVIVCRKRPGKSR